MYDEPEPYETLTDDEWQRLEHVWDQLEDGRSDDAQHGLAALLEKRPGHPDLLMALAALHLGAGDARSALEALSGAERSADPALFFHLRASAHFEHGSFEAAREDGERALAIRPDSADTHDLMSRISDHLGDPGKARGHAAYAADLDPEDFPAPLDVDDAEFDALVEASLAELPAPVRARLTELPVVVEDLPSREMLTADQPPLSPDLLGLFVGPSLFERGTTDVPSGPGAIYLFRHNLLRAAPDRPTLAREIRTTVLHEVGHLLGLDEDELDDWGLA